MEMNCKLLKERPRPAVAHPRSPNYDNHLSPGILEGLATQCVEVKGLIQKIILTRLLERRAIFQAGPFVTQECSNGGWSSAYVLSSRLSTLWCRVSLTDVTSQADKMSARSPADTLIKRWCILRLMDNDMSQAALSYFFHGQHPVARFHVGTFRSPLNLGPCP